ncbi:transposase domain-containing protein [Rhizobium leguminosarum]|uniref:transposase domain-containing protein n=1 Tax=Rhizobium leguminosarum TaxID=384 RepID=UPI0039657E72
MSTWRKLSAVDPLAYLTPTLTSIVNGHKRGQITELLPWNYPARQKPSSGSVGISKHSSYS